jgi:Protein of unknown function (DUF4054)
MSSWVAPTVSDFKNKFVRDFPYAPESDNKNQGYILDGDIQSAIDDALIEFNSGLFGYNATAIFYYLIAYHLCQNINNSTKGLSAQAQLVMQNSSVGGVSVGNMVVGQFADDPNLSKYLKNAYGQKYLELIAPYTIGNVRGSAGATTFA